MNGQTDMNSKNNCYEESIVCSETAYE